VRVIAGQLKGRRIEAPGSSRTRPTSDKVREAVFSMIQFFVPEKTVLDLFAGSGALGIEALSRGAEFCVFCDNDPECIQVLSRNIKDLGLADRSHVLYSDALKAMDQFLQEHKKFDLVLIDPPYDTNLDDQAIQACASGLLTHDGIAYVEQPALKKPLSIKKLAIDRIRVHGRSKIVLYKAIF